MTQPEVPEPVTPPMIPVETERRAPIEGESEEETVTHDAPVASENTPPNTVVSDVDPSA